MPVSTARFYLIIPPANSLQKQYTWSRLIVAPEHLNSNLFICSARSLSRVHSLLSSPLNVSSSPLPSPRQQTQEPGKSKCLKVWFEFMMPFPRYLRWGTNFPELEMENRAQQLWGQHLFTSSNSKHYEMSPLSRSRHVPGRLCVDLQGPLFSLCSALLTGMGRGVPSWLTLVAIGINEHSLFLSFHFFRICHIHE